MNHLFSEITIMHTEVSTRTSETVLRSSRTLLARRIVADKAIALIPMKGAIALDASSTAGTVGTAQGTAHRPHRRHQLVRELFRNPTPCLIDRRAGRRRR